MRLLHTADWHLGRLFHGVHLTDDQAVVLDQVVALAAREKPDVVIIAGDVYDRAVPTPEAVALLDDVLARLVRGVGVPVICIAGNHDSPTRLAFASRLLTEQGLHVFGPCRTETPPLVLEDAHGPVSFFALPYVEPPVARGILGEETITDHDTAMRAQVARITRTERAVLITHAFVSGGDASADSERPLTMGGTGTVDAACFDGFSYVALGHLHRPQRAGGDHIHYSGSLLRYAFSESDTPSSVNLVEIDAHGACTVERIPLAPRRNLRILNGLLDDLLLGPPPGVHRDDYLQVNLQDTGAILDAIGRLREVYPNVLELNRPNFDANGGIQPGSVDHRKLTAEDLFADFFAQVTGEELSEAQRAAFNEAANNVRRNEREVTVV